MTIEVERPAGLGRFCLRDMQMEEYTHQAMLEALRQANERRIAASGGQMRLPMWLPEYTPSILPADEQF